MNSLKAFLECSIRYTGTKTVTGLTPSKDKQSPTQTVAFDTGVGANQANEVYCIERTLAGGATEDLDLYGSLTNNLGDTFSPARIKGIVIFLLTDTAATSITVGGYGANAWIGPFGANSHTQTVFNGGFYANVNPTAAGWTVTNGTVDKLRIVNNDGAVTATYLICLIAGLT